MANEIENRNKIIRSIRQDMEEIHYYSNNYVFDDKMTIQELKELQSIVDKLWLFYDKRVNLKNGDAQHHF